MANLAKHQLDPDKTTDGVWFEFQENMWIQLSRADSREYDAALVKRIFPHRGRIRRLRAQGKAEPELPYIKATVAEVCVKGWGTAANGQRSVSGETIKGAEDWQLPVEEERKLGLKKPLEREKDNPDPTFLPCTPINARILFDCRLLGLWEFVRDSATSDQAFQVSSDDDLLISDDDLVMDDTEPDPDEKVVDDKPEQELAGNS